MTWAVRVLLATGPLGVAVIAGGIGLLLLRLRRCAAWAGRARRRRQERRVQRKYIAMLEAMFRD